MCIEFPRQFLAVGFLAVLSRGPARWRAVVALPRSISCDKYVVRIDATFDNIS
jgi:hypothetical protein